MKSEELQQEIDSLREKLNEKQEEFELAVAHESGLIIGETIVKDDAGNLYRVTSVKKFSEFTNVSGQKKLKNGLFSGRESYIGIMGHGIKIAS